MKWMGDGGHFLIREQAATTGTSSRPGTLQHLHRRLLRSRVLVLGSPRRINQPVWKLGGVVYFGEGVSLLASGAGGVGSV